MAFHIQHVLPLIVLLSLLCARISRSETVTLTDFTATVGGTATSLNYLNRWEISSATFHKIMFVFQSLDMNSATLTIFDKSEESKANPFFSCAQNCQRLSGDQDKTMVTHRFYM